MSDDAGKRPGPPSRRGGPVASISRLPLRKDAARPEGVAPGVPTASAPSASAPSAGVLAPGSETRRVLSKAYGLNYEPLESLALAAADPAGCVVLEGDDGGQIYLVCPASRVGCTQAQLLQLLADLDALAWPRGSAGETRLCFERHETGSHVPGGMGGGQATGEVWLHETFEKMGLGEAIRDVVAGRRTGLRLKPGDGAGHQGRDE